MPPLIRLLLIFFITWTPHLSLLNGKESIPFFCPHRCGQLGSKQIQEIEWAFTLLLYQADKIHTFLSEHSKPYHPKVLNNPTNFAFSYSKPQDFHSLWYQDMVAHITEGKWIRLGIQDLDTDCSICFDECECYSGSCNYIWGMKPIETEEGTHIGKIFIRKECNYVEEMYDDDEDIEYYNWLYQTGDTFSSCSKTKYQFDHFVDFKEACFHLNKELTWLREDVHGLSQWPQKHQIRSISDSQYNKFLKELEEINQNYSQIFSSCIKNHQAPSAFYHIALQYFEIGDYGRGLQCIENVFNRVDLNELEPHLASNISFSQGTIQNEVALYDQALLSLKQALDHNPKNKKAYFDQALAFFEQGKFQESIESYLNSQHTLSQISETNGSLIDFSLGLIQGITTSAINTLTNFIPSMFSSLYGLSHGLWAFACAPNEVSQEMIHATQTLAHFLTSHTNLETLEILIPELKSLKSLPSDQHQEKGKIIGTIIGKYGMECLTCLTTIKGLKLYRELKQANGALTLHMLTQLEKQEKLQAISLKWWEKTAPVVKEIKTNGGRVGDNLYKIFQNQTLSELQVRRILHKAGFKTFPKPKGIPNHVTVQLSKKNGGMVYMKAGTTKEESILVRVMPGNPKSPNLMQKGPYVVQRRGKEAIKKDGKLIDSKSTEAHIPLSEFEFKGW